MLIAESTHANDVWDLLCMLRRAAKHLPGIVDPEDIWNVLQQPAHSTDVEPSYRLLRAALDMGWWVEEPVYLRPRWSDDGPRVYHFILRRPPQSLPRLLSVPESPEVDRFVRDEGLRVSIGK